MIHVKHYYREITLNKIPTCIEKIPRVVLFHTVFFFLRDEDEDRIIDDLVVSKADMGLSGLYITNTRIKLIDFSPVVMQDCGTFMSLGSFALSK